ncbi:hypothetical protein MXD63_43755, partial [Frankia sp. Cpl3]|nr:hypothetical protein [Frankia sp. Cpl3]
MQRRKKPQPDNLAKMILHLIAELTAPNLFLPKLCKPPQRGAFLDSICQREQSDAIYIRQVKAVFNVYTAAVFSLNLPKESPKPP